MVQILELFGDFNPRSHEGSDPQAPYRYRDNFEFQSTLPRGERHKGREQLRSCSDFNPRSHEGSDNIKTIMPVLRKISIHAPTRGATLHVIGFLVRKVNFNPRSHEGSDVLTIIFVITVPQFQSTLPRGERRSIHRNFILVFQISIHAPTRGATPCQFSSLV